MDMDGTIIKSNIFAPYVIYKLSKLSLIEKMAFIPSMAVKGLLYLLIDRYNRTLFNTLFYANYAGMPVADKDAMAACVLRHYFQPKIFPGAAQRIAELKREGYTVVLVTGSLDFLVAPLAAALGVDEVIAAQLEEADGAFTGRLVGPPVSDGEKALRLATHAATHGVDLQQCQAYGDSYADIPMLQVCTRACTAARVVQRQWPRGGIYACAGGPAVLPCLLVARAQQQQQGKPH